MEFSIQEQINNAWAAGLFEGEGCITTNGSGMNLEMVSTDLDVLQKFLSIVKIGKIYGPTRQKCFKDYYKDSYRWRLGTKEGIKEAWERLGPHMCIRRTARFDSLKNTLYFNGNITRSKRKPYKYKNKISQVTENALNSVV